MLVHCFLGHSTVSAPALALFFPKPSCSSMCPTKYESLLSFSKVASSSPFSVPSPSSIFYNVVLFIFIDGLSPGSMLLAPPPPPPTHHAPLVFTATHCLDLGRRRASWVRDLEDGRCRPHVSSYLHSCRPLPHMMSTTYTVQKDAFIVYVPASFSRV